MLMPQERARIVRQEINEAEEIRMRQNRKHMLQHALRTAVHGEPVMNNCYP